MKIGTLVVAALPIAVLHGGQLMPTAVGTAWRYNMTEEVGKGMDVRGVKAEADGKIRVPVLYRIDGTENVDGKDLLKFEMHRGGVITNTDLVSMDEQGMVCRARINLDDEMVKLNPPQTIIANPLRKGVTWNFNGRAGELEVRQRYDVVEEEDVEVPAGEFHTFHIHGEQSAPNRMTIDRWFASGIGIVKDVTTMRAANGDLLQRVTLELAERPKNTARPEVKLEVTLKQLAVSVAAQRFGKPTTTFRSNTPEIYARWRGHRLRIGAKVKAVWIAENIGEDLPQDYKIDEASATAEGPSARGAFTLTRPDDGWAIGDYRVEFYVDNVLADTVKVKIVQ